MVFGVVTALSAFFGDVFLIVCSLFSGDGVVHLVLQMRGVFTLFYLFCVFMGYC